MTIFGPSIASSMAGAPQAERAAISRTAREDRERARIKKSVHENTNSPVDQVELTDAVRNLKDNAQEETHEDRQEHPQYNTGGHITPGNHQRPKLDIQG